VTVEVAVGLGGRLADVVDERREPDDRMGDRRVDRSQRVVPEVLAGDLVLGHAGLARELRQDRVEQPGRGHQPQPDRRPLRREDPIELHGDPLPGEVGGERGARGDRRERRGLDLEAERRGEPDGPEHPQRVLLEPGTRIADRAQRPGGGIGEPAERVDEARGLARRGAPGHRVDGEVATREVGVERRPELDPMRPAMVGVIVIAAERW
jgi:hypothetical protein